MLSKQAANDMSEDLPEHCPSCFQMTYAVAAQRSTTVDIHLFLRMVFVCKHDRCPVLWLRSFALGHRKTAVVMWCVMAAVVLYKPVDFPRGSAVNQSSVLINPDNRVLIEAIQVDVVVYVSYFLKSHTHARTNRQVPHVYL